MQTVLETIHPERPEEAVIQKAAACIRRGELVAFPTETVYGLGADALRPEAAQKIYAAKGRPSDNPLIVHIAQRCALKQLARRVPQAAWRLADAFWPGPLTMILPKAACVPAETTGGLDTVAVRFPAHPAAQALIRASGCFIAAPSANASGRPSPTCAAHVREDLAGKIPLILDGGTVGIGLESTIVDLSTETIQLLRPGFITGAMLDAVLGSGIQEQTSCGAQEAPRAPGMKYRHYAPQAPMTAFCGPVAAALIFSTGGGCGLR